MLFKEGFGEHQNRKFDMEELAGQEVRTRIKCVDSHAIYSPPVCVYFNFNILYILFFIVYFEIVCHVLCDI